MTEPRPTDLLGVWQLERRLSDRRSGGFGRVTGWLELTLVGAVVHWLELGELTWDGATHQVTRELHIVGEGGTGWTVRFTDGREFHPWRPGELVEHPCRDDLYRGLIDVATDRKYLRVLWDVRGPSKDQRIVTRCVRSLSPVVPTRPGRHRPH
ncbi:MAG: DUF6314 family protein, partial [Jatrophihabitantaceae bacterium]